MKLPRLVISFVVGCLLISGAQAMAKEKFTAKTFAGSDGKLTIQQAAIYIIYRDKEPLSKFIAPGQTQLDINRVIDVLEDELDNLRTKTGKNAPWLWQDLDKAFPPNKTKAEITDELPKWKNIEGITTKKEFNKAGKLKSVGPFLLRKSTDDLSSELADSSGATLAYAMNRLSKGDGALNSEGVLDYPLAWNISQKGSEQSIELGVDLATQWKVAQVQDDRSKDVEELNFSIPFSMYVSPGNRFGSADTNTDSALSALIIVQGKPYFQTDFGFNYKIWGVEASTEYVGSILGSKYFYLGGFQNLASTGLQYRLRLVPRLDYSVTGQEGRHTTRKKDDSWLRIGATSSLDFRLGLAGLNTLDLGASYQFFQELNGAGGYSKLFKTHMTLWLVENVGTTIEYKKGDTPIADKPIDLIMLGMEFKY